MLQSVSLFKNKSTIQKNRNRIHKIANILNTYNTTPKHLSSKLESKKIKFYEVLVDQYNARNFALPSMQREDINIINTIYANVKKPTTLDIDIVENSNVSLENLALIFEKSKKHPNLISVMKKLQTDLLESSQKSPNELIKDILNSKNLEKYVSDYDSYKSYFKLKVETPDAIKNLDKMIEEKTFYPDKYNKLLDIKSITFIKELKESSPLSSNNLITSYNENGTTLLKKINQFQIFDFKNSTPEFEEQLFDIYKTTNEKNLNMRIFLFKELYKSKFKKQQQQLDQQDLIKNMRELTEIVDKDSHAHNFVKKMIKSGNFIKIELLNKLLQEIPVLKLDIFDKNAFNIIKQVNEDSIIETLNENLTKPNFETNQFRMLRKRKEKEGDINPETFARKVSKHFKNMFKVVYYNIRTELNPKLSKPIKKIFNQQNDFVKNELIEEINKNHNIFINNSAEVNANIENLVAPKMFEVLELIENKPSLAEIRKNKKQEVVQNILNIVKSKLGTKAYAKQQNDFSLYATNIRLKLLPEIFNSIAETRQVDKQIGKLKSQSSNNDAIKLFQLINGNNKKLVNYLLKKRNVDNTRMFEVKDIINILKKAEDKISTAKKTNPNYKARDARAYYNHLYEAKIQEFGKLTKSKKS